jgi:hypothetical protein
VKNLVFLLPFTACCGLLPAQSSEVAPVVTHQVRFLAEEPGYAAQDNPDATKPLIINTFTILGDNITGTPCYSCVTGATTPNLGILQPSGIVKVGTQYQINVFLVDENYTGSCTYTYELTRGSTVIYSSSTSFNETAPTAILLGSALTIPTGTTSGSAAVSTTAVCGSSTTKSSSAIYIKS